MAPFQLILKKILMLALRAANIYPDHKKQET